MKSTKYIILRLLMAFILFPSCQEKIFYAGDDRLNASPFKRNLLKKGGRWEVSREDNYYTDNQAQEYLGSEEEEVIGIMKFTKDEPPIQIAGDMGTWTPSDGPTEEILYQVTARSSIQVAIWKWEDGETTDHAGYVADLEWDKFMMVWEGHDNTHRGDTLVKHVYYFRNLGY